MEGRFTLICDEAAEKKEQGTPGYFGRPMKLILDKNRNGPTGIIDVRFHEGRFKFE